MDTKETEKSGEISGSCHREEEDVEENVENCSVLIIGELETILRVLLNSVRDI